MVQLDDLGVRRPPSPASAAKRIVGRAPRAKWVRGRRAASSTRAPAPPRRPGRSRWCRSRPGTLSLADRRGSPRPPSGRVKSTGHVGVVVSTSTSSCPAASSAGASTEPTLPLRPKTIDLHAAARSTRAGLTRSISGPLSGPRLGPIPPPQRAARAGEFGRFFFFFFLVSLRDELNRARAAACRLISDLPSQFIRFDVDSSASMHPGP